MKPFCRIIFHETRFAESGFANQNSAKLDHVKRDSARWDSEKREDTGRIDRKYEWLGYFNKYSEYRSFKIQIEIKKHKSQRSSSLNTVIS